MIHKCPELNHIANYALISGAEFQPPDTMIFYPFDINEMEDQIIEYHGELDPDSNYFNQFSHRLNKSSNYYVEDSFNKYIKKKLSWKRKIFFHSLQYPEYSSQLNIFHVIYE